MPTLSAPTSIRAANPVARSARPIRSTPTRLGIIPPCKRCACWAKMCRSQRQCSSTAWVFRLGTSGMGIGTFSISIKSATCSAERSLRNIAGSRWCIRVSRSAITAAHWEPTAISSTRRQVDRRRIPRTSRPTSWATTTCRRCTCCWPECRRPAGKPAIPSNSPNISASDKRPAVALSMCEQRMARRRTTRLTSPAPSMRSRR